MAVSEETKYSFNEISKIAEKNMQLAASEAKDNLSQSEPRISSVIPKCSRKRRVFFTGTERFLGHERVLFTE